MNKKKQDEIFLTPLKEIKDFTFNDEVADVFEDMITRSVPGYSDIVAMIGVLAKRYYQSGTVCYDLGCSLGAVSFSIWKKLHHESCRIIAVDKSEPMIRRLQQRVQSCGAEKEIELLCKDICDVDFEPASFIAMNFTLQFLPQQMREIFLRKLYEHMTEGSALVISEKILLEPESTNQFQIDLYHTFKKNNGYSDLEISQKRTALEKVLLPESLRAHDQRLKAVGFKTVEHWFQCFNFASMVAVK